MRFIAASVIKRELRKALRDVQNGPIGIKRNRKLTAILVSVRSFAELTKYKENSLRHEISPHAIDAETKLLSTIAQMHSETRWVPTEEQLQRDRAVLLKDFERKQNLPLEVFAELADKSVHQVYADIESRRLLALGMNDRGKKIPDWQLDSVKLQLTQSVLKQASNVDSWTLYYALSKPLEGLCWRTPLEEATADSVNDITGHVLNFLGFHE